jgi:ribosomal protein S14
MSTEPPSDCVHEHYETVYSSERHRDERRCVECGAWSPPAIEPPSDSGLHRLKVGYVTGERYCERCGRSQPWPCPQAADEPPTDSKKEK